MKELTYVDSYDNILTVYWNADQNEIVFSLDESGFQINDKTQLEILIEQLTELKSNINE